MTLTPTPALDLEKLEAIAKAATPGPWIVRASFDANGNIIPGEIGVVLAAFAKEYPDEHVI